MEKYLKKCIFNDLCVIFELGLVLNQAFSGAFFVKMWSDFRLFCAKNLVATLYRRNFGGNLRDRTAQVMADNSSLLVTSY